MVVVAGHFSGHSLVLVACQICNDPDELEPNKVVHEQVRYVQRMRTDMQVLGPGMIPVPILHCIRPARGIFSQTLR